MGKCVSRHKQHKRRGEYDAPYEPAEPQAIAAEDKQAGHQKDPVAGKLDDPVPLEEVNGEVLDELQSVSTDDHGNNDNLPNDNNEAASNQVSDSQTEPCENSAERQTNSDSNGGHGDQNETTDSKIKESKKSKHSSPTVAIAISQKPHTSIVPESTNLHQVLKTYVRG